MWRALKRIFSVAVIAPVLGILIGGAVVYGLTGRAPRLGDVGSGEVELSVSASPTAESNASTITTPEPTSEPTSGASAGPTAAVPNVDPEAVRYVSPDGDGAGDSWEDAAVLDDLPELIRDVGPGGEVWIGAGEYRTDGEIVIDAGGAEGEPVTVRGVTADGTEAAAPIFVGTRARPYDPEGAPGEEVFRLLDGADHLAFRNLHFRDQGNGCFRFGADVEDVTLERMVADNVRRFVENVASGDGETATISGLTIREVQVAGYSKGAIRLDYDTHDVVIDGVSGDSQGQDLDDFAIGVALQGTVHDVVIRRSTMANARDTSAGPTGYWNGDGFTAEADTYRIRYEDTVATGNTDGGYDLKGTDITLLRTRAESNGRNYRLWGTGIVVDDCVGRTPMKQGGSGDQVQVQALGDAQVTLTRCVFQDNDPESIVFVAQDFAVIEALQVRVIRAPSSTLTRELDGGRIRVELAREAPS